MADKFTPNNKDTGATPSRLSNSASVTIGGNKVSSQNVSAFSHGATGAGMPRMVSDNVRTGGEVSGAAEARALNQTEQYRSTNAQSGEKTEVHSGIVSKPNTEDAVKTTATPSEPKSAGYQRPQPSGQSTPPPTHTPVQPPTQGGSPMVGGVKPTVAASGVPLSFVGSQNMRTVQEIASAAQERAFGNVSPLRSGMESRVMSGIQTGGVTTPTPAGERSPIPAVGVGQRARVELTEEAFAEIRSSFTQSSGIRGVDRGAVAENVTLHLSAKQAAEIAPKKELMERFRTGTETGREFVRGLGKVATYEVKTEAVNALKKWNSKEKKSELLTGGKMLLANAEGSLMSKGDLGDQSASGIVAAGLAGYGVFKGAQVATKLGGVGIKTTGEVSVAAGKAAITVGKTAKTVIMCQFAPFSKDTVAALKRHAIDSGLVKTAVVKNIITKVDAVKARVAAVKAGVRDVVATGKKVGGTVVSVARGATKATIKTAVSTVRVVRGVATGRMTVAAAYTSFRAFRNRAVAGVKVAATRGIRAATAVGVRGVAKGVGVGAFRGAPTVLKVGRGGSMTVAGMLSGSDDIGAKGASYAIQSVDVGIKTAKAGVKATGYTVKTSVKGVKKVRAGINFIRKNGLRAALKKFGANAGKSVVSALLNAAKGLLTKAAIPLLLIVCVGAAVMGSMGGSMAAVGSMFGGTFNAEDTNAEHDVRDYMSVPNSGVPAMSLAYRQDLANQMQNSWSNYHIVRLYSNTGNEDVVEPTLAGVTSVFPTDEELINMLQPIFNAMVIMEFELEPSEAEARALLEELLNGLFRVSTVTTTERCGQALLDGSGSVTVHSCGEVHALADCPNNTTGTHSSWYCDSCDSYYYICQGHQGTRRCGKSAHSHTSSCYSTNEEGGRTRTCGKSAHSHSSWISPTNTGCYSTSYCNGGGEMSSPCSNCSTHFRCTGYNYCVSHEVISYTLNMDGAYALEARYFTDPINDLSGIASRTEEQEEQLTNLKDYYEIYQEIMRQVGLQYGGVSMDDLSSVQFVNGTRVPCQAVIDLALSQVGQQGGQPYWSYYGFRSRVAWCACFVHWCMRNTPSATNSYPTTANNAYCPTLANNFMAIGQWGDRAYTDVVAGDTIFFDWEGDGVTDHIGLVIGTDGTYVYTVEGNSGDAVKLKTYNVGSSVIYGYGLINY